MPSEKDGVMIILSSPSGAGKTTLVKKLSEKDNFEISISHTTRQPRPNENQNEDYFFIEELEFKRIKETTQKLFFVSNKDIVDLKETKKTETIEGSQTNMFENFKDEKNGELKNIDTLKHYYQTINTNVGACSQA